MVVVCVCGGGLDTYLHEDDRRLVGQGHHPEGKEEGIEGARERDGIYIWI